MKLFKWKNDGSKPKFTNFIESIFGKNIKRIAKDGEEVSTVPSANIADEDKAFEIELAVPGLDKEDINIQIENSCLVVSSEKQYSKEDTNKNYTRKEYGYASFQRIFQLPKNADLDQVHASLKNGILKIIIAKDKTKEATMKKIAVQ